MAKVPDSVIANIVAKIDIVDLISSYIELKKQGVNFVARCPFHKEKTPSFVVSPKKQIFSCFGCGHSGDSIKFMMLYKNQSFISALETLASKVGINLSSYSSNSNSKASLRLYECTKSAADFYFQQLKTRQAMRAVSYLKKRGITGVYAKKYNIGYAPDGWHNLQDHLRQKNISISEAVQSGVLATKDNRHYDRFRNRIIFPIRNKTGRVLGFGSRIVVSTDKPKYLNSPEGELFHKSECLYGIYELSLKKDTDIVFVVEGYLDVIALAQVGLNAVATLGTALTKQHVEKLYKLSKAITFCFDGDAAGILAAKKASKLCLLSASSKFEIRFLELPAKEDPDTVIRKYGKDYLLSLQKKAPQLVDYYLKHVMQDKDLHSTECKAQILHTILDELKQMPDKILKKLMLIRLEKLLNIDIASILANTPKELAAAPIRSKGRCGSIQEPENIALALLLVNPELVSFITDFLDNTDFSLMPKLELFEKVATLIRQNVNISDGELRDKLPVEYAKRLNIDYWRSKASVIPKDGVQEEFLGAISCIKRVYQSQELQKILSKAKQQGLSIEEKRQLQSMLMQLGFAQ